MKHTIEIDSKDIGLLLAAIEIRQEELLAQKRDKEANQRRVDRLEAIRSILCSL
jgi:hypothetical protein